MTGFLRYALITAIGMLAVADAGCSKRSSLVDAMDTGADGVAQLLRRGADVRQVDGEHRTALHVAAGRGNVQVVRELLRYGAPVDVQDENGETPLYMAAISDRVECVEGLIDAGARTDAVNGPIRLQALHAAAFMGRTSTVIALLRHGADPNAKTTWGETPLHLVGRIDPPGGVRVVELLLAAGADPMARDVRGFTPLHSAALADAVSIAKLYVDRGYELNTVSTWGTTPLDLALDHTADRVAQVLFAAGASVKLTLSAEPPLHTAARLDDVDRAQRIIAFGGDDRLMFGGKTASDIAKEYGSADVAALIASSRAR